MDTFRYGVGDRGASVRIPSLTNKNKSGYLEDRRPSSNMDPYIVCSMLVSTTLLQGKHRDHILKHYSDWMNSRF